MRHVYILNKIAKIRWVLKINVQIVQYRTPQFVSSQESIR